MPNSGAGGPCDHCGRTQTCCWRRGPPSKPVLCNACGSRYLVKRSLDGYKPLQIRQATSNSAKVKSTGEMQEARSKRALLKRLDSDQIESESALSEESVDYLTDDSAEQSGGNLLLTGSNRHYRMHPTKYIRITNSAQLKDLGEKDLQSLAVSLLQSSLRTKPRKPLNPTITALF